MLIAVEGPDGAGKTTLLESLRGCKYPFTLITRNGNPKDPCNIVGEVQLLTTLPLTLTVLVDRHPLISEPIYGTILRDGVNRLSVLWTEDQQLDMLRETVTRIIYCRPPIGTIQKNLRQHPQLAGVELKIDKLVDAYDFAMNEIGFDVPVLRYDYTRHNGTPRDIQERVFTGIPTIQS